MSTTDSAIRTATVPSAPSERLASIDVYRGLVMFLMMAEVLELGRVSGALPDSGLWRFLAHHQTHVEWRGLTLHDLIQPSFSFLVGAALPFSLASRRRRGESAAWSIGHAAWRAVLLTLLGVFLRSVGRDQTNWTFEDTLSQIGLGYLPLFLIALGGRAVAWGALGLILVGYTAAFVIYPGPGAGFDPASVGVPPDWPHQLSGFAAHWNKNTNLAWACDRWFLNLFPREEVFTHNGGGYSTLSFIPTLGTMILGLLAGWWLREGPTAADRLKRLVVAGAVCLGIGTALDHTGLLPSVKRIWTPSWVLVSGGWCFLLMAAFHAVLDVAGWQGWAFPLRVIGVNSIAAYVLAHVAVAFFTSALHTHLGEDLFRGLGAAYEPLVLGAAVLFLEWLVLWWMYRRKLFLRV